MIIFIYFKYDYKFCFIKVIIILNMKNDNNFDKNILNFIKNLYKSLYIYIF